MLGTIVRAGGAPVVICTLSGLVACGGGEVAGPDLADPSAATVAEGREAFIRSCASCHASRDGFDLAFFGFTDATIVRRARAHVDQPTAEAIATYIRTIDADVPVGGRGIRPFQPGDGLADSDEEVWIGLFGADAWTDAITVERLRTIDLRELEVPFGLPVWSNESDDGDWLPNSPLPQEVLTSDGGRLQAALDEYYAGPTTGRLVAVLDAFDAVGIGPGDVCEGDALDHPRPVECFEALRWLSSLGAQHLFRTGDSTPPPELLDVWWRAGEAAVTIRFRTDHWPREFADENTTRWLYLPFSFAPTQAFPNEGGYLGQFVGDSGRRRLSTLTQLVRLVRSGEVDARSARHFHDAFRAVFRSPNHLSIHVARFVSAYVRDGLRDGTIPVPADPGTLALAREHVEKIRSNLDSSTRDGVTEQFPVEIAEIEGLRDEILALLDS